jgi:hypothetical protein
VVVRSGEALGRHRLQLCNNAPGVAKSNAATHCVWCVISFSGGSRSCMILRASLELHIILTRPRAGARGEAGCTAVRRGRTAAGAGQGQGQALVEGKVAMAAAVLETKNAGKAAVGAPVFGFIGACVPARGAHAGVRARPGGHEAPCAAPVPTPRPGVARRSIGQFVTVEHGIIVGTRTSFPDLQFSNPTVKLSSASMTCLLGAAKLGRHLLFEVQ